MDFNKVYVLKNYFKSGWRAHCGQCGPIMQYLEPMPWDLTYQMALEHVRWHQDDKLDSYVSGLRALIKMHHDRLRL